MVRRLGDDFGQRCFSLLVRFKWCFDCRRGFFVHISVAPGAFAPDTTWIKPRSSRWCTDLYLDSTLNWYIMNCVRDRRLSQIVTWHPNLRRGSENPVHCRLKAVRRRWTKRCEVIFLRFELPSLRCFHFELFLLLSISIAELE